jgi:hypothetical protein
VPLYWKIPPGGNKYGLKGKNIIKATRALTKKEKKKTKDKGKKKRKVKR